jgi:hypothetical protein
MHSKPTRARRVGEWIGARLRVAFDAVITAFVFGLLLRWLDVLLIVRL